MRKKYFYKYYCFIVIFFSMFYILGVLKLEASDKGKMNFKSDTSINAGVINGNFTNVIFEVLDETNNEEIKDVSVYRVMPDGKEEFVILIKDGTYHIIFPTDTSYTFKFQSKGYHDKYEKVTFKNGVITNIVKVFMKPLERIPEDETNNQNDEANNPNDGGIEEELNTETTTIVKPQKEDDKKPPIKETTTTEVTTEATTTEEDRSNVGTGGVNVNSSDDGISMELNGGGDVLINRSRRSLSDELEENLEIKDEEDLEVKTEEEVINENINNKQKDKSGFFEKAFPAFKNLEKEKVKEYATKATPIVIDFLLIIRLYLIKKRLAVLLNLIKKSSMRKFNI